MLPVDRRRDIQGSKTTRISRLLRDTMDSDGRLNANVSEKTRKRPYAAAVEQQGETTASTAACTTSPRPENGKRRRRKLSCETCQRLKCRCDYDPVSRTCHRCKTLRHDPSLRPTQDSVYDTPRRGAQLMSTPGIGGHAPSQTMIITSHFSFSQRWLFRIPMWS